MRQLLNRNWFIEGLQDFEYKKYLLLAYLQGVKGQFDQALLYPPFQELIEHYNDLHQFQQNLEGLRASFPKAVQGIDPETLQLKFGSVVEEGEALKEVEEILDYSLPQVKQHVEEGGELYELIDQNLEIEAIGILPLTKGEGYLLVRQGNAREVRAFEYQVTVFEQAHERYRGIHTRFVSVFDYGLANTFESLKLELVRRNKGLPNPATYLIHSRLCFPEAESLLPVAKRKFMRYLAMG